MWKLSQKSSFFFLVWVPIFDGEFITDTPKNLLESGKINQKDVMIGERLTCVGFGEDANATYWQIARGLLSFMQPKHPQEILQGISNDRIIYQSETLFSDLISSPSI